LLRAFHRAFALPSCLLSVTFFYSKTRYCFIIIVIILLLLFYYDASFTIILRFRYRGKCISPLNQVLTQAKDPNISCILSIRHLFVYLTNDRMSVFVGNLTNYILLKGDIDNKAMKKVCEVFQWILQNYPWKVLP